MQTVKQSDIRIMYRLSFFDGKIRGIAVAKTTDTRVYPVQKELTENGISYIGEWEKRSGDFHIWGDSPMEVARIALAQYERQIKTHEQALERLREKRTNLLDMLAIEEEMEAAVKKSLQDRQK